MGRPLPATLPMALDPVSLRPHLEALARERFGYGTTIHQMTVEPLRRGVVRYSLGIDGPEEAPPRWRVIGKAYDSEAAGRRSEQTMRRLRASGFDDVIAEPFAFLTGSNENLLLMEALPGVTLKRLVKSGKARPDHMRLFAEALARLHRGPILFQRPFTIDDHLAVRCHGLIDELSRACPHQAEAIEAVVEAARASERPESFTLAHGDYHLGQLQIDGDRSWLLDLDPVHLGDPAYDLAMVAVVLRLLEAGARDAASIRALREVFFDAYSGPGAPEVAARIPLQAALIHLKRACKRLHYRDEVDWPAAVEREVRRSVACLALDPA